MTSTFRTFNFLISTILIFIVYPFIQKAIQFLLNPLFNRPISLSYINEVVFGLVFLICFLFLGGLQGLIRTIYLKHHNRTSSIMKFPINHFQIGDKTIYYIVPLILYIVPLFKGIYVNEILVIRIIIFIITIILIELWLRLSKKHTHCYFLRTGLLVTGFDIRLDFPLQSSLDNASGFYPYEKFQEYILFKDQLIFKNPLDTTTIRLKYTPTQGEEIKNFLALMKIPQGDL